MTKPDWEKIPPGYGYNKKPTPIERVTGLALFIVVAAFVLFLGIIYFMISIWVIRLGAKWSGFDYLSGETIVLTAGIVTAGVLISSALRKY